MPSSQKESILYKQQKVVQLCVNHETNILQQGTGQ